jgi:hypothetical protein
MAQPTDTLSLTETIKPELDHDSCACAGMSIYNSTGAKGNVAVY